MRKLSILFIAIWLFSSIANADLTSEFGLSLSKANLNNILKQISGEFRVDGDEIELGREGVFEDITHTSSKFFLDADLDFAFKEQNILQAKAFIRTAGLRFENFSYTDVTIINRGGVRARVTTKVTCPVLEIGLKNWDVLTNVPVNFLNSKLLLNQRGGDFKVAGSELDVDLSSCRGPKGAEGVFKNLVLEWIYSPEGNQTLFSAVLDYGQDFIDDQLQDLEQSLNLNLLGKEVLVSIENIEFNQNHVDILGLLTAKSEFNEYKLFIDKNGFENHQTGADIILPKEFFSKLLPDFFKDSDFSFKLLRAEIPGVDVLFNSRLVQFFVWRDLLNFKKSSNFSMEASLKAKSLDLVSSESSFKYRFRGEHSIDMNFVDKKERSLPYMNFSGALSLDLDLSFSEKGVSLGLMDPFLTAAARWHENMDTWRRSKTKKKPNMRILTPRIRTAIEETEFEFSWEDLGLDEYIQSVNLYQSESSVFLSLNLK